MRGAGVEEASGKRPVGVAAVGTGEPGRPGEAVALWGHEAGS